MEKEQSPFPDIAGIETELALQRLGGNEVLLKKLMGKFVINHSSTKEEIVAALARGDKESAYRLAHSLKSVSGALGAIDLEGKAGQVCLALKRGESVSGFLDDMDNALQNALQSFAKLK